MNNTINLGGMSGYYNSFIQTVTENQMKRAGTGDSKGTVSGGKDSFASTIQSKIETSDACETKETAVVSTKDMTLDEYKQYVYDKINRISIHPSLLGDNLSINISEDAFKEMQDNPEYEKWVLDKLSFEMSSEFSSSSRMLTGKLNAMISIGASKEDYHSVSWSEGYQNGNGDKIWKEKSQNSFWEHRGKQKEIQVQADKKAAIKRELEKKWQKESIEKRQAYTDFLNGKAMLETKNISDFNDVFSMPIDAKVSGILSDYEAGTFM